jgi:hypothetical protein
MEPRRAPLRPTPAYDSSSREIGIKLARTTRAAVADKPPMLITFRIAGRVLSGVVDIERGRIRWKWGGERWSWPWQSVGSA